MTAATAELPEGYMRNAQGHLVPTELVGEWDKDRDALVREIVDGAKALQASMATFKAQAMGDVESFAALAGERYGAKVGGMKGNITLSSFDGRYRVQIAVAERLTFNESIKAAQALVYDCIHAWTEGSRVEIKALVEHAFQVDREGKINLGRILTLLSLSIEDEQWQQAMRAIRDAMQVAATTSYLRVYERIGQSERYQQIALDLAAL